jgi:hypothetical protein
MGLCAVFLFVLASFVPLLFFLLCLFFSCVACCCGSVLAAGTDDVNRFTGVVRTPTKRNERSLEQGWRRGAVPRGIHSTLQYRYEEPLPTVSLLKL